jgi:hypothetical protein
VRRAVTGAGIRSSAVRGIWTAEYRSAADGSPLHIPKHRTHRSLRRYADRVSFSSSSPLVSSICYIVRECLASTHHLLSSRGCDLRTSLQAPPAATCRRAAVWLLAELAAGHLGAELPALALVNVGGALILVFATLATYELVLESAFPYLTML